MNSSQNLSQIDQFLSQILADKSEPETGNTSHTTREEPLALNFDKGPSLDEEEYVNFVMQEIIQGKESVFESALPAVNSIANQLVPAVCQPVGTVMATYQIPGHQQVLIPVVTVAQPTAQYGVAPTPTPVTEVTPASTPTVAESPVENPDASSSSKKRKLYEMTEFTDDPNLEKRRRNAVNAKNHRQKTKETIGELQSRLNKKDTEIEELRIENQAVKLLKEEMVSAELRHQQEAEDLKREIASLREENARLKQQGQQVAQDQEQSLQQEKLGVDFFDFFPDNFLN